MFFETKWDMTEKVADIRALAEKSAVQAIETFPEEVRKAWKAMAYMEKTVEEEGILALEEKLPELEKLEIPRYETIKTVILLLTDATDTSLILEVLVNDYYIENQSDAQTFIAYLYMLCVQNIKEHLSLYSPSPQSFSEILEKDLKLIPEEYREEFAKV